MNWRQYVGGALAATTLLACDAKRKQQTDAYGFNSGPISAQLSAISDQRTIPVSEEDLKRYIELSKQRRQEKDGWLNSYSIHDIERRMITHKDDSMFLKLLKPYIEWYKEAISEGDLIDAALLAERIKGIINPDIKSEAVAIFESSKEMCFWNSRTGPCDWNEKPDTKFLEIQRF